MNAMAKLQAKLIQEQGEELGNYQHRLFELM